MKKAEKLMYGAAAVAATGLLIYAIRRSNTKRRMAEVANEGYETAADVLHPKTNSRFTRLHYGPVLPHHEFGE